MKNKLKYYESIFKLENNQPIYKWLWGENGEKIYTEFNEKLYNKVMLFI